MQDQDLKIQASKKDFLQEIAANNYKLPDGIEPFAFAQALLANLASPDAELRDDLSSIILAGGIINQQKLTQQQLEELLSITLDRDHLFYRIGETGTDSVFMRSFSSLIIASILFNDSPDPHFPPSTIINVKEKLFHYAQEEKDWRGYIEGKGWAHAMAHLADALDECAQHPHMSARDRQEILVQVSELATLGKPLYHEEDIRLAKIAYHIIIGRQVDEDFIDNWIDMCSTSRELDVVSWTRITNAKNVLRSLYFLLHWDNMAPLVTERISSTLYKQDEVYLEKKTAEE
ncbi:DUF2785 domain-containing protein [Dictyobacter kobayashii]|uniref:Membrane protein n=1 Tax=Dictyobacter kobayashii TaxID=2014872 RepID=A0A402AIX5_9CHLR|nr:DUF2785 domain-containing protein [Dictyobacter kobayashii]GCE19072.1 membrane protein [Dictyobacter kobayashii]